MGVVLWCRKCGRRGRSRGFHEGRWWLLAKKGGREDLSRGVPEEEGLVIEETAMIIVGVGVIIARGVVEWFRESNWVLGVEKGKVVGRGWVQWKAAEEKDEEVTDWWSEMGMSEDSA